MFKVFSRQLLIRPDLSPYLMASNRVKLLAGAGEPLYWTNEAQVVENTLNGAIIKKQPFIFSFKLHDSVLSDGTTFIFDYPGLMAAKSEKGKLAFKFYWRNDSWTYLQPTNLQPGYNEIVLSSNGVKLYIEVGGSVYTFVDESVGTLTKVLNYTNNGCTIDGYIAKGTTRAYLEARETPSLVGADSWEFGTKFWYIRGPESYQVIFGPKVASQRGLPELAIQRSNDQLYVNVASSASSANSTNMPVYLNSSQPYTFKVYKKAGETGVYCGVSIDDWKTFDEYKVSSTDQYAMEGAVMTYLNGRVSDNRYSPGEIDTSKTYMTVDGVYYSYREELIYDQRLPELNIGELKLNLDWTKITGVRAILL